MTALLLAAALASMIVAAVVSGFETGVYALSHIRLRHRISVGDRRAGTVETLLAAPQQLLTGILLAQNAAIYCTTAIVASLLDRLGGAAGVASTLILAFVLFIFVDALPKNLFRRAADVLVYPLARPFALLMAAVRPAGVVLAAVTRVVSRLAARQPETPDPFFSRERLAFYLREGLRDGILSNYQVELAHNILKGEKITVERAMVPLEKAALIPFNASLEDVNAAFRANHFSRYPVFRDSRSAVVGILNIYDFHFALPSPLKMDELMRPAVFLSPDTRVTEAIRILRDASQVMGVVAENGRALGVVTLKDCLEEIVGELYAW